jgi:GNAT superfamily N-acetyltransferase
VHEGPDVDRHPHCHAGRHPRPLPHEDKPFGALEDSLHVGTASEDDWRRDGFGPTAKFNALIAEIDGRTGRHGHFQQTRLSRLGWQRFFPARPLRRGSPSRALMAALAAQAQAENAAFIELTVDTSNRAREFYQRMGFAHISHCMTYVAAQPALGQLAADATMAR